LLVILFIFPVKKLSISAVKRLMLGRGKDHLWLKRPSLINWNILGRVNLSVGCWEGTVQNLELTRASPGLRRKI